MKVAKMLLPNKGKFIIYLAAIVLVAQQQLFTSEIKIKNEKLTLASDQSCWLLTSTLNGSTLEKRISLEEGVKLIARQQQKDHSTISRIRAREATSAELLHKSVKEHGQNVEKFLNLSKGICEYLKLLEAHYEDNLARVKANLEPKYREINLYSIKEVRDFLMIE